MKVYQCKKCRSTNIGEQLGNTGMYYCRNCNEYRSLTYRHPRSYYFMLAYCAILTVVSLFLAYLIFWPTGTPGAPKTFTDKPEVTFSQTYTGEVSSPAHEPQIALERCAACVTYSQAFYQYTCPDGFILDWSEPSVNPRLMENLCVYYGHGGK
jgi:hypothetical protein